MISYDCRVLTPREFTALVPISYALAAEVGAYTKSTIEMSVLEQRLLLSETFAVRFRAQVLEDQPREQVHVVLASGVSVNWWQQWKDEFAPRWYLRRWPVRRRTYQVTLTSTAHQLFPRAQISHPQLGKGVVIVEHDTAVREQPPTTMPEGVYPGPDPSIIALGINEYGEQA